MFENPTVRFVVRAAVVGLVALLASLQGASAASGISLTEVFGALVAGVVAGAGYAGVAFATPIDKTFGKGA